MDRVRCGKTALFDMDTSLFDLEEALRRDLQLMASPEDPPLGENLWDEENKYPYLEARMKLIKAQPGFWERLSPIADGFRVWEEAKRIGFDMCILTKGPWTHPTAWAEKVKCCQTHFGNDIDIKVVTYKSGDYGYFLYDDYGPFMDEWIAHRPRGWGIMPVTATNRSYSHPRVIKYDGQNFDEVSAKLQELFTRK